MTDTTHNGWTNYATWRVALEWFDDTESCRGMSVSGCEDVVTEHIESLYPDLACGYALAFLAEVNWHEIAYHLAEDETHDHL